MPRKDKSSRRAKQLKEKRRIASAKGRLAEVSGEIAACYVNEDWRDNGMAMLYLVRRRSAVEYSAACFLVDTACFGLKDAWGVPRMTLSEFNERFIDRVPDEINLVRCDIDLIRRLVFGGVAFARQQGFRLPHNYEKWLRMIGQAPPIEETDTSDFGRNGKLVYVGSFEELHQRLARGSVEDFLDRPDTDVNFTGVLRHPDQADVDFEDDEMSEEEFLETASKLAEMVRQWCLSNGRTPSPYLDLLAEEVLYVIGGLDLEDEDDEITETQVVQDLVGLKAFCEAAPPTQRKAMSEALEQIIECMAINSGNLLPGGALTLANSNDLVNQNDNKASIILPFRPNA
ncbi:MAG: hypothetical protein HZA51_14130 [Planctomycetes bacterium]|nr:hypothetical protein [Planctomycetota bacterium]